MEAFLTHDQAAAGTEQPPPDFRPFGNRLLLKYIMPETNGVLLPESVNRRSLSEGNWARVIAVGPGLLKPDGTWLPVQIPVGAKVLLPDHPVLGVAMNGEAWLVCHENELLGQLGEPELQEGEFRQLLRSPSPEPVMLEPVDAPFKQLLDYVEKHGPIQE